jgi:hypothetical protein
MKFVLEIDLTLARAVLDCRIRNARMARLIEAGRWS